MGDPAISVFYNVTIDGVIPLGFWTKVDGLGMEYEVFEYREGGVNGYMHKLVGPVKFTNLRLSRPVDTTSPALMMWLGSNQMMVVPQTMAITAMTASGEAITTWNLVGAVPVKWTGPSLDVLSNNLATETLEVAYQEISLIGGLASALTGAIGGAISGSVSASVSF
jgi:phage tail-like protein